MSVFSPANLLARLHSQVPLQASGLCVALSGGLDSTVLLHALRDSPWPVRALHIDHGLHADSAAWDATCRELTQRLGIRYDSERVVLRDTAQVGIEAAARTARYDVFRRRLRPNETLLTAHHADDQLETVLLALLRGSGPRGLAAMPTCVVFGDGWHLRPLLEFTRAELEAWAQSTDIHALTDPSNAEQRFDRNYLRATIIPRLKTRWPALATTVSRAAQHCAEANDLLGDLAAQDLAKCTAGRCVRVDALRELTQPRRRNVLRFWLQRLGLRPPSTRKLISLEHDMLNAAVDRNPSAIWDDAEVHRYRGLLYATARTSSEAWPDTVWNLSQSRCALPDSMGQLKMVPNPQGGLSRARLPHQLRIARRTGGERVRRAGSEHHQSLKKLLQEAAVLPWWRERIPLLYAADKLVAVADLWVTAEFAARAGEESVSIVWEDKPVVVASA